MKKRILTLLLALVLVLSLAPAAFAGAETAQLSTQKLKLNGFELPAIEMYNIDGSNYFKLRDVAALLDGTAEQFNVGYDNATKTVALTSGESYDPVGGELEFVNDNSASTVVSPQNITVDGKAVTGLKVYNIGGSNFFQLRELGATLGFADAIGYDNATRTVTLEVEWKEKVCTETTMENISENGRDFYRFTTEYNSRLAPVREVNDFGGFSYTYLSTYDADGNRVRCETYDDGVLSNTQEYRYDADGNEIWYRSTSPDYASEITTTWQNGLIMTETFVYPTSTAKNSYYYDANDNLIRLESMDGNNSGTIETYTYDANGNQLTCVTRNTDDAFTSTETRTYDKNGNMLTCSYTTSDGYKTSTTYAWDAAGRMTGSWTTDNDGQKFSEENTYDANGNLVKSVEDGKYTTTWTYDANGNCIREDFDDGENTQSSTVYTFDANGLLLKETYTSNGIYDVGYVTVYTYDADGDEIRQETTRDDGSSFKMESFYTYIDIHA